jgi:hypothetical protein
MPPLGRLASSCRAAAADAGRLLVGLLRELGDERAYARYLAAHGLTHSGQAWRDFSEKRLTSKYVRPRCC